MPGTFLFGVDVESNSEDTRQFCIHAPEIFEKRGVNVTWYVTGRSMELYPDELQKVDKHPLLDVQSHTYSHMLLKTVVIKVPKGRVVHGATDWYLQPCGSLEEIDADLGRCQDIFRKVLGRPSSAMTTPWGYYRGLSDRPDLLAILDRHGFRAVRSYARNADDGQPVDLDIQPFHYSLQGYPHILECPVQFYQDEFYWRQFAAPPDDASYLDALKLMVDEVVERDLIGTICTHDHDFSDAAERANKEGWYGGIIDYALEKGGKFLSISQLYEQTPAPVPADV